ncbi:GntR family transcriptional regulator [Rothia sp. P13129]|uniref:GntR family transcriptional regulator n=1 Tax=unclassified Rothia (in: high G+C Gram-positive bacteria) TaxID=2689056 RepID=UPI003AC081D1
MRTKTTNKQTNSRRQGANSLPAEPKYRSLARIIEERYVLEGKPHDTLPTERELQNIFNVSRDTIRRALYSLSVRGLIYNIQGSGTYIAECQRITKKPHLTSFTEDMTARGHLPASTTESCSIVPASATVARNLNISAGEDVYEIIRLRTADGVPMAYERAYFLVEAFAGQQPQVHASLDEQLQRTGYRIVSAHQRISATNLNAEEALALEQPFGIATLKVERIGYTERGIAVESTQTLYRADRYDYEMRIIRDDA